MKRWITKRALRMGILCLAALSVLTAGILFFGKKEASTAGFGSGVSVMANGVYLAASAPTGEAVTFSPEWLETALGAENISAIEVKSLPPVTEGKLMLGHGEVHVGQTIPRETLSYLAFYPADGVRESGFSLSPQFAGKDAGYTLDCRISLTDGVNCCPKGAKTVQAVSTYSALAMRGTLVAVDPEGDAIYYEAVRYPAGGTLTLDAVSGAFSYLPRADFTGKDSFVWRAQDKNGAFGEPVTVSVLVRERGNAALFCDIADDNVQSAALRVSAEGVMSGEMIGGKPYFLPDGRLSRAEFVAVLLRAAEIPVPDAADTGFADDGEIPAGMKGAIRYAKDKGYIENTENFRPRDPITRAEAAKIASAVLKLGLPSYAETVADFAEIPVDAADALYALFEGGYLETAATGALLPSGFLTRGDAARFFARILDGKAEG